MRDTQIGSAWKGRWSRVCCGWKEPTTRDLMQVNISERPGLIWTDTPATEWARIGGGGVGPAFQGMALAQLGMASWRCPLWREGDCASLTHHTDTDGAPSPHSLDLSLSRSRTLTPQEPPISPPTTQLFTLSTRHIPTVTRYPQPSLTSTIPPDWKAPSHPNNTLSVRLYSIDSITAVAYPPPARIATLPLRLPPE